MASPEKVCAEMYELERELQKNIVDLLWARFYRVKRRFFAPFKLLRYRLILKKLRKAMGE